MDFQINHIRANSHIEMPASTLSQHSKEFFWQILRYQPITENVETNLPNGHYDLDRQEVTTFAFTLDPKPQNSMCLTIRGMISSDFCKGATNSYELYVNDRLVESFKILHNNKVSLTLQIPEELLIEGTNCLAIRGTNDWVFHIDSIGLKADFLPSRL